MLPGEKRGPFLFPSGRAASPGHGRETVLDREEGIHFPLADEDILRIGQHFERVEARFRARLPNHFGVPLWAALRGVRLVEPNSEQGPSLIEYRNGDPVLLQP